MPDRLPTLTFLVVLAWASIAHGGGFCRLGAKRDCGGEPPRYYCCPVVTQEPVEKECFTIEVERICVPRVRFLWQDCRDPLCSRLIKVHRLKKKTYECGTQCVYKWEVRDRQAECTGKPDSASRPPVVPRLAPPPDYQFPAPPS